VSDTLIGLVTKIIDGDTFDIKVIRKDDQYENSYSNFERIRIADMNAPELDT